MDKAFIYFTAVFFFKLTTAHSWCSSRRSSRCALFARYNPQQDWSQCKVCRVIHQTNISSSRKCKFLFLMTNGFDMRWARKENLESMNPRFFALSLTIHYICVVRCVWIVSESYRRHIETQSGPSALTDKIQVTTKMDCLILPLRILIAQSLQGHIKICQNGSIKSNVVNLFFGNDFFVFSQTDKGIHREGASQGVTT